MKKNTIILAFTVLTLLIGCSQVPKKGDSETQGTNIETTETMSDTSANSLDWMGIYQGVIPCADCQGIETFLSLNKDMSYLIKTKYLGKDEQVFEQKGTFTWNSEGNTVLLNDINNGPSQYFVGENILIQLDMEGKRITGDLADNYILKKLNANMSILDTHWKLTELMGKPVENSSEQNQDSYIILKTENNKLEGFGGCNNFLGNYELKEGDRITFSQMISTQKACSNMETETALFQVLETADNYHWNGSVLMLHKGKMAPLAKFEAVENK